jgi:hypothetical protein
MVLCKVQTRVVLSARPIERAVGSLLRFVGYLISWTFPRFLKNEFANAFEKKISCCATKQSSSVLLPHLSIFSALPDLFLVLFSTNRTGQYLTIRTSFTLKLASLQKRKSTPFAKLYAHGCSGAKIAIPVSKS